MRFVLIVAIALCSLSGLALLLGIGMLYLYGTNRVLDVRYVFPLSQSRQEEHWMATAGFRGLSIGTSESDRTFYKRNIRPGFKISSQKLDGDYITEAGLVRTSHRVSL